MAINKVTMLLMYLFNIKISHLNLYVVLILCRKTSCCAISVGNRCKQETRTVEAP